MMIPAAHTEVRADRQRVGRLQHEDYSAPRQSFAAYRSARQACAQQPRGRPRRWARHGFVPATNERFTCLPPGPGCVSPRVPAMGVSTVRSNARRQRALSPVAARARLDGRGCGSYDGARSVSRVARLRDGWRRPSDTRYGDRKPHPSPRDHPIDGARPFPHVRPGSGAVSARQPGGRDETASDHSPHGLFGAAMTQCSEYRLPSAHRPAGLPADTCRRCRDGSHH